MVTENTELVLKHLRLKIMQDKQLNNFYMQAPIPLSFLRGPGLVIEFANDKILNLWGKSSEQVMNKPVFEALPELMDQHHRDIFNRVFHQGEKFISDESPLMRDQDARTGRPFRKAVYEPLREDDGSISGIMVYSFEDPERFNTSENNEDSVVQLNIAVDAAEIGTFNWDIQQSKFEYSGRFAQMFGYSEGA
jgi:PAS domain-containing protein